VLGEHRRLSRPCREAAPTGVGTSRWNVSFLRRPSGASLVQAGSARRGGFLSSALNHTVQGGAAFALQARSASQGLTTRVCPQTHLGSAGLALQTCGSSTSFRAPPGRRQRRRKSRNPVPPCGRTGVALADCLLGAKADALSRWSREDLLKSAGGNPHLTDRSPSGDGLGQRLARGFEPQEPQTLRTRKVTGCGTCFLHFQPFNPSTLSRDESIIVSERLQ
jgi:hypothetical protein